MDGSIEKLIYHWAKGQLSHISLYLHENSSTSFIGGLSILYHCNQINSFSWVFDGRKWGFWDEKCLQFVGWMRSHLYKEKFVLGFRGGNVETWEWEKVFCKNVATHCDSWFLQNTIFFALKCLSEGF